MRLLLQVENKSPSLPCYALKNPHVMTRHHALPQCRQRNKESTEQNLCMMPGTVQGEQQQIERMLRANGVKSVNADTPIHISHSHPHSIMMVTEMMPIV